VSVLRALAAAALLGLGSYYLYKLAELPQSQVLGPTITHGSTARHAVALTYDDGPNPPDTDGILMILRAHHAHATFFVNGIAAQTAPQTLKRMHAEGNEIENHGWDHGHLEALLTAAQIDAQLARTDDAIAGATGSHTHYLRPPFGLRDRAVIDEAAKRGYATVMWTGALGWGLGPDRTRDDRRARARKRP
jgi:peptidoglycan/xylan/chitin deacetylase (PgdA/CDA1 family)